MTKKLIPLSSRFSEALRGTADLHAKQFKKGTTIPYIAHLLGVASIALHHGADEDEAIAALLHDAIEDAPVIWAPTGCAPGSDSDSETAC